ncbi:MAG: bestrophin family ion channel [Myxococcota bacterium]
MMVNNRGSVRGLLRWQRENVVWSAFAASIVVLVYKLHVLDVIPRLFTLPTMPVAVVGGAIGIFVSFRTNSAYDRWWEGRKLWGRLINTSRHFSTQVLSWIGRHDGPEANHLVRRHIAYVHTLRCLLRTEDPFEDTDVRAFLTEEELAGLRGKSNTTHAILHLQHLDFTTWADAHDLDPRRLQQLDESVRHLLDIQGGCERIKKTPLPRGYGYIAEQLIRYYAWLLPLAIVEDLHILTIPMNVLICLSFSLISEAGRVLEDPFTMFWNGLPLTAMSKTIENDLRSRMGEVDLPPVPGPDADGILM